MNVKRLNIFVTIAALAITSSFGSLITVAEWNFNNLSEDIEDRAETGYTIDADVGNGLFFIVNGQTSGDTNLRQDTGNGTTLNASDDTAGGSLWFRRRSRWHGNSFDFRVDTTGLSDIKFSFAMLMADDSPDAITVSWTTDEGGTLTELETIQRTETGFPYTVFSYDFTGNPNLDNQENLWFRFVFSSTGGGAVGGGTALRMDNVIVTAIPEPGTLVLVGIAIGGLVLFRRRR